MTLFNRTKTLKDTEFKRLMGIKRSTFNLMIDELLQAEKRLHLRRGRHSKLSLEDRLMMTLEYWREYRTMFHISVSYGVSKSSVSKTITWVEDVLSKSKKFALPGKKELQKPDLEWEVFVVDATENAIERPQKKEKKSEE